MSSVTVASVISRCRDFAIARKVGRNISNVGPIMGNLSQEFSYADLNMASKYILIVLMMIGRLEIYAFFAIFSYSVWSRN